MAKVTKGNHLGRFRKQKNIHVMKDDGMDNNYTLCSSEYRKDYEITSLAGPYDEQATLHYVTCKACLKKLAG